MLLVHLSSLLFLFAPAVAAVDALSYCPPGSIFLYEIERVTLRAGAMTVARRSAPVPQLTCVAGPCPAWGYAFGVVTCVNTNHASPIWKCTGDSALYELTTGELAFEGFTEDYDLCKTVGSASLKYGVTWRTASPAPPTPRPTRRPTAPTTSKPTRSPTSRPTRSPTTLKPTRGPTVHTGAVHDPAWAWARALVPISLLFCIPCSMVWCHMRCRTTPASELDPYREPLAERPNVRFYASRPPPIPIARPVVTAEPLSNDHFPLDGFMPGVDGLVDVEVMPAGYRPNYPPPPVIADSSGTEKAPPPREEPRSTQATETTCLATTGESR
jgi:hypothetical protein